MKTSTRIFLFLCWLVPVFGFSQASLQLKLQLIEEDKWGVFVRPMSNINPSLFTQMAAAQVTIVMPVGFQWSGFQSVHGTWNSNARIDGPPENPSKTYQSFGWVNEFPHIDLISGQETLLFTFKRTEPCPDTIYLIDNNNDPFLPPNSLNSNVGNDLSVFDPVGGIYDYHSNYSRSAWSCHDCDGDGILNAYEDTDGDGHYDANNEDTNGNGILDAGEDDDSDGYLDPDASIICNPCDPVQPFSATIGLAGPGSNIAEYAGDDIEFSVNVAGGWPPYTITWTDGQQTFTNTIYSGATLSYTAQQETTLELVSVVDSFYCTLSANISGSVPVEIMGEANFSEQPADATTCAGSTAVFVATASLANGSFSFTWQSSNDGGQTWANINQNDPTFSHTSNGQLTSGTDSLLVTASPNINGLLVRAATQEANGANSFSAPALLSVDGPLSFINHPAEVRECFGNPASFSSEVVNLSGVGQVHYQWQIGVNNGATWFNLSNLGIYSGTNTATLQISNIANLNNAKFRLTAWTDQCGVIYSDPATLIIEGPITVTTQPANQTVCTGSSASFTANATAGAASIILKSWQVSSDGGLNWLDINAATDGGVYAGFNTGSLSVSNATGLYNRAYRLAFSTGECATVYSNKATLTVQGPLAIVGHPSDAVACVDLEASFSIYAVNQSLADPSISYQWQESTDGGVSWSDLTNSAAIVGANASTLTLENISANNGYRYRCAVGTIQCAALYSDAATLNVEGPIAFVDQPLSVSACHFEQVAFSAEASLLQGNAQSLSYQWQLSSDGTNFTDISEAGVHAFAGYRSAVLHVANTVNLGGYYFRLSVSSSSCGIVYSQAAQLTIIDCPPGCVKLKLGMLPDSSGWGVYAKPFGAYVPTNGAMTTAGRVTLVAPDDFVLDGFHSNEGAWLPSLTSENVAGYPGRKFFTIELQPQSNLGTAIPYNIEEATLLFTFEKDGPCPDSLYLLENQIAGIEPNQFSGTDVDALDSGTFEYCGVYARKAWRCQTPGNSIPGGPIVVDPVSDFGTPQDGAFGRIVTAFEPKDVWFTASPNPAGDFVNIQLNSEIAEGNSKIGLWDLQGKLHQSLVLVENNSAQLDLSNLPVGVYLITLRQNGKTIQREKLVKR